MRRLSQCGRVWVGWAMLLAVGVMGLGGVLGCKELEQVRKKDSFDSARFYLEQGRSYRMAGNVELAMASLNLAIRENPRLAQAYMEMGAIQRQKGDIDQAGRWYERAAELSPTSYQAQYYMGLMKHQMGQMDQAVRGYLRALAIEPENLEANAQLAEAYLQMGQPTDVLPYARKATQLKRDYGPAWVNLGAAYSLLGQYDQAAGAYGYAVNECGMKEPAVRLGLAEAWLQIGEYARGEALLGRLVVDSPSAVVHERMGYALFKQDKIEPALESYRAALAISPEDVASLNGVGTCLMTRYIQTKRTDLRLRDQAVEAWRKSLRIKPDQPGIKDLLSRYQQL